MSDKIEQIRARHKAAMMSHKQTESAILDLYYDRETLLAEVDRQRAEIERLRETNKQLVEGIDTITRRKQVEIERLEAELSLMKSGFEIAYNAMGGKP